MAKPITYYAQNEAIDALVAFYGPRLEQMTRTEKSTLLAGLLGQLVDPNEVEIYLNPNIDPNLCTYIMQLEDCEETQKLALIMAIASELGAGEYIR